MKHQLLFSLLFLFILPLLAQPIEFAPLGAKWEYHTITGWTVGEGFFRMEYAGDTLIEGKPCKRLCGAFNAPVEFYPDVCTAPDVHVFFLTQSNDSIFLYGGNPPGFWHSFKMTYHLGDSTLFPNLYSPPTWFKVKGVDTLFFGNHSVRCFRLHYQATSFWPSRTTKVYDVFGPVHSFFAYWWGFDSDGTTFTLTSYEDNNFPKIAITDSLCAETSGSKLVESDSLVFLVSPNPAHDFLYFNFKNIEDDISYLWILDTEGQLIIEKKWTPSDMLVMDIGHLSTGLYYFIAQGRRALYQQKIVKY